MERSGVFTGAVRRQTFTAAEKAMIIDESYTGEDSVCGVARCDGQPPRRLPQAFV